MTHDEFTKRTQEVNSKALAYARHGPSLQLREEIWLNLWEMRRNLFQAKAVCGYLCAPPSGQYETGEEFLTEVFLEIFPRVLNSYAKAAAADPEPVPFLRYFNRSFFRKVCEAYSGLRDAMPHDSIVVPEPAVQAYQEPREDMPIPNISLKQGAVHRVLGQVFAGGQEWIKTELKRHGRTVYVRKAEVQCQGGALVGNIDDIFDLEAPGRTDDQIMTASLYESYILHMLSLAGQLYAKNASQDRKGLTRGCCFRLFYTETLLEKLKRIYDVTGDVRNAHEREALSAAELELLDYLLTEICRSFPSLAVTPLHAYRDFAYLNNGSAEEIRLPAPNAVYAHFLRDVKGIDRKLDAITPSLSKYRTEFKTQYDLICGAGAADR